MKFTKKPVTIEATQWFKNGDHPDDYVTPTQGFENGHLVTFTAADRKARGWEGSVVRYFCRPDIDSVITCLQCGQKVKSHQTLQSADDTDGHGLGECVELCSRCLGSGTEPKALPNA